MLPLYSLNKEFSLSLENEKSLSTKKYFKRININNNNISINDHNRVDIIGNIFLSSDIIKKDLDFVPSYSINIRTEISDFIITKEVKEEIQNKKIIEKKEIEIKILLNLEKKYINHFQFLPVYNQDYFTIQSIFNFQFFLNSNIDGYNIFKIIDVKNKSICTHNSKYNEPHIYLFCNNDFNQKFEESNIVNELKYFIQNESKLTQEIEYSSIYEKLPEIITECEVENNCKSNFYFNTNLKNIQRCDFKSIFNLPKSLFSFSNFQDIVDIHIVNEKNDNKYNWINNIENAFQCRQELIESTDDNNNSNNRININKIDLFDMTSIQPKLKSNYLFTALISNIISTKRFKKISSYSMMKHGVKSSRINNLLDKSPWRYIPVKSTSYMSSTSNIDNKNLINVISNIYYNLNISHKTVHYTESLLNLIISNTNQLSKNKIINEYMGLVCGNTNLFTEIIDNNLSGENDINNFISLSLMPIIEKEVAIKQTITFQNSSININKESKKTDTILDSKMITPKQITINNSTVVKRNIIDCVSDDENENTYEAKVFKKTLLTPQTENYEKETLTNKSTSRNLSIDINNIRINENNDTNKNFNIDNIEDNVKDYLLLHSINVNSQENQTNDNQSNNSLTNKFNSSISSNENSLISNNILYDEKIVTDKIKEVFNKENNDKHDYGLQGLRLIISDSFIEDYPLIIYDLSDKYNILTIDCPIEKPITLIIDIDTAVSVISIDLILNKSSLKNYLRLLTKQSYCFKTIWIIVVPIQLEKNDYCTTKLKNQYIELWSLYSSISKFPCNVVVRQINQISDLSNIIFFICKEAITKTIKDTDCLIEHYIKRSYLNNISNHAFYSAHCEFLQLFSTINFLVASQMLSVCSLKELIKLDINEIINKGIFFKPNWNADSLNKFLLILRKHLGIEINNNNNISSIRDCMDKVSYDIQTNNIENYQSPDINVLGNYYDQKDDMHDEYRRESRVLCQNYSANTSSSTNFYSNNQNKPSRNSKIGNEINFFKKRRI